MLVALIPALTLLLQTPTPGVQRLSFSLPDGGKMPYAVSIPRGYNPRGSHPLVLALHPGGPRTAYYGAMFMQQIVLRGVGDLAPIVVAPDCPGKSWTDPGAERAVLALLESVLGEYAIDRRRILVVGFSMGGRGTWFLASKHPSLFTAAIPMAAAPGEQPLDGLAKLPTFVIHSRDDEVMPFAPSERAVEELKRLGGQVGMEALEGIGHFEMGAYIEPLKRAVGWVVGQWK
jgi:predicted peptidase